MSGQHTSGPTNAQPSDRSSWPCSGRCCTRAPANEYPAALGASSRRCTTQAPHRWPAPVTPLVDGVRTRLAWPPHSASPWTPAEQLIADALELSLPAPPALGAASVAGLVPVWRARQIARETHRPRSSRPSPSRTGSSPPSPRRIGQVDAARLVARGAAVLRPRPCRRRRGRRAGQARRLATHTAAPGHHRRAHDPGHPRRAAVRPDRQPHRRATCTTSATPTTLDVRRARAVGILADPQYALDLLSGRDGAAPTPVAPAPRTSTSTSLPQTSDRGAPGRCSIEKLGAATTRAARRLAGPLRSSRRQDHPPARARPRQRLRRSTSTTHPRRCANA